MTKINLDERLREKQATLEAAKRAVQSVRNDIWRAGIREQDARRAAAIDAFRALYPFTDGERVKMGYLIDAFEPKWDRSYENLVAMLR